jgi:hypothetical protein
MTIHRTTVKPIASGSHYESAGAYRAASPYLLITCLIFLHVVCGMPGINGQQPEGASINGMMRTRRTQANDGSGRVI